MGKRNNVLSEEEKNKAVELYQSGLPTTKIAIKYGVWPNAISGLLKRRNIKLRSHSEAHRKYKINETFFDDINSEEKAYILGLFYADGSNNIRRYKAYIMLAEEDIDILEKIKKIISPEKPLHYQKRKSGNPNHQNRYMFYIDNKHISKQLENLGCVTNKTYILKFPDWLDEKLYNHFIRGYFDGDGHIGIYNNKSRFSIVGTESFCLRLKEIFEGLDINTYLYCRFPERGNSIRDIRASGNRQVERLLNWLYSNSTIYMDRKYRKYQQLKQVNRETDEKIKRRMERTTRS